MFATKLIPSTQKPAETPIAAPEIPAPVVNKKVENTPRALTQKEADEIFFKYYNDFYKIAVPVDGPEEDPKFMENLLLAEEKFFTKESLDLVRTQPEYQQFITFYGLGVYDSVQAKMEKIRNYIPPTEAEKNYWRTFFTNDEVNIKLPPNEEHPVPEGQMIVFGKSGSIDFPPPYLTYIINNQRIEWNVEGFNMDLVKVNGDWKFDINTRKVIED